MSIAWYPLTFVPVYKKYLWGGNRMATLYGRLDTPARCAESWECSSRPEGMSRVRNGHLAGRDLAELIRMDAAGLLGTAAGDAMDFPLLIKIIDARERLSVQVHPDDATASAVGGEPKTEVWYILAAEPDARLIRGFVPGTTRDQVVTALAWPSRALIPLLNERSVMPGDVVFVPGGTVHAIGAGILLLEVQQSSNTTYRLYDWDRVDSRGRQRTLHVEPALAVIDWNGAGESHNAESTVERYSEENTGFRYRTGCPWFVLDDVRLRDPLAIDTGKTSFHGLFGVDGGFTVDSEDGSVTVGAGSTVLVPAAVRQYSLRPTQTQRPVQVVRFRTPD